jgi:PAS domain S-box-containing protein
MTDASGRYLFANRQFQQVFGLTREQVIGNVDADVLAPRVAQVLVPNDRQVVAQQVARELEEAVPTEDGVHTYISLKVPLLDAAGVVYGLCSVATDITERKRADEALQEAKKAAEEANRELEAFSYSVAHDLRAPLRGIDGFSQALIEDYSDKLDDEGRHYLGRVRESAQHMAELIEGLLGLARLSRSEMQWEAVDLSNLARASIERLRASDPDRSVECVIEDGLVQEGDARLLAAVLENLLANAWKFTRQESNPRIEFGRVDDAGGPFVVRDNGAGFDMDYASKLFGVFQRLHAASEFEGTGIGLATVQRIVRRHGGRIWAEGEVGQGATFYFTLQEAKEGS